MNHEGNYFMAILGCQVDWPLRAEIGEAQIFGNTDDLELRELAVEAEIQLQAPAQRVDAGPESAGGGA